MELSTMARAASGATPRGAISRSRSGERYSRFCYIRGFLREFGAKNREFFRETKPIYCL